MKSKAEKILSDFKKGDYFGIKLFGIILVLEEADRPDYIIKGRIVRCTGFFGGFMAEQPGQEVIIRQDRYQRGTLVIGKKRGYGKQVVWRNWFRLYSFHFKDIEKIPHIKGRLLDETCY